MSQVRPVYIDGPLAGREFAVPEPLPVVYAFAPDDISAVETEDVRAYRLREFTFHMGGSAVRVWIGWCSPGDPSAEAVAEALFKPEVFERTEVHKMPRDLSLL